MRMNTVQDHELTTKFTLLESAFKYIYEKHWGPAEALARMQKDPYLSEILPPESEDALSFRQTLMRAEAESVLEDKEFFQESEDVFLNLHSRYMPPYQHKHRFFELQYVMKGTLDQVIAGQELTLHAGDVCFIAPDTEHALSVFDDDTIIVNILIRAATFRSVFISQLNKDDIISDFFSRVLMCNSFYPYIYCRTKIEEKLTPVILAMIGADQAVTRLKNRLLVTKLEEFFIYLLDAYEYDFVTGSSIGETDKKALPILRFIQDHFKTVTLSEMAAHFNYSESYLSRLITMYFGSSFSQIIRDARLKHAASLLVSTDMSIAEISAECGYEDKAYFHRTFKKQYGMTPQEYRKKQSFTNNNE